jgi:hypothetical protein
MTRLRRRPRTVYRVYGEEEYLAGAGAFTAWEDAPPAEEPTPGRRLQRLAGAAALTGAVGTVGGVVGLAGLRAHAVDRREIAQRVVPPVRAAPTRGHASTPAHMARRRTIHPIRPQRVNARRGTAVALSHRPTPRAETAARTIAVSAPQASAAQHAPAAAHAGPRAQSEFGFER